MDNMIFEVAIHIKWSKDKSGAILIYDRINKDSFLIDTMSGKMIWEGIMRKATLKELVEEIRQSFKTDKSSNEIKDDAKNFINDLANANIIHKLEKNS